MQTATCPNAPKLDPRVRRTRKLLEDALRALLKERSYNDISVGDIAERATVNRATFYAHFEDKSDLATNMLRDELHDALLASLSERAPFNAETLEKLAIAIFEYMARTLGACPKHRDDFASTIGPTLQETIQEFFQVWLDHDPKAMRVFPGAAKEAVATVLAWSLYGAAYRWSRLHHRPPVAGAAREIIALLIR